MAMDLSLADPWVAVHADVMAVTVVEESVAVVLALESGPL